MSKKPSQKPKTRFGSPEIWFLILGCALCLNFAVISLLGRNFRYELEGELPIVPVVVLYFVASILSLTALMVGFRTRFSRNQFLFVVVLFSISFRAIQIFSSPILEVDFYRYMWDGIVTNEGLSPYQFSPQEALSGWQPEGTETPDKLEQIRELALRTESINTIVQRVHFEEYSTIYPPVSQWVFAGTMWVVPDHASVEVHMLSMKMALVLFDLATIVVVGGLVGLVGVNRVWVLAYAWNPLVIKEIANSGHLDSIAVFFVSCAVYFAASELVRFRKEKGPPSYRTVLAAAALSFGVGAKIFPIILAPLLVLVLLKWRWSAAILFTLVFTVLTSVVMAPMVIQNKLIRERDATKPVDVSIEESREGLSSFLTQWRMNDVVFSCIFENARPDDNRVMNRPWYVVVSNERRLEWTRQLEEMGVGGNIPFHVARVVTLLMFLTFYAILVLLLRRDPTADRFLNSVFLVIAVFFCLQPTQNPWYWLWALPFVGFAVNRGWLVVAPLLFVYYLRFWFEGWEGSIHFADIDYRAEGVFDYLVVFVEFGLMAVAVICFRIWMILNSRRKRQLI